MTTKTIREPVKIFNKNPIPSINEGLTHFSKGLGSKASDYLYKEYIPDKGFVSVVNPDLLDYYLIENPDTQEVQNMDKNLISFVTANNHKKMEKWLSKHRPLNYYQFNLLQAEEELQEKVSMAYINKLINDFKIN